MVTVFSLLSLLLALVLRILQSNCLHHGVRYPMQSCIWLVGFACGPRQRRSCTSLASGIAPDPCEAVAEAEGDRSLSLVLLASAFTFKVPVVLDDVVVWACLLVSFSGVSLLATPRIESYAQVYSASVTSCGVTDVRCIALSPLHPFIAAVL